MPLYVPAACFTCLKENGKPGEVALLAAQDQGPYSFACEAGHIGSLTLQQFQFQVLFEMGLIALRDGYPREGVLDFKGALEDFFTFYLRLTAAVLGVEVEALEAARRAMSSQSERQLGSYVAAHLLLRKTMAMLLPQTEDTFRNDVVHKGHVPTEQRAVQFGQAVADLITSELGELQGAYPDAIQKLVFLHIQSQTLRIPKGVISSNASVPTKIELSGKPLNVAEELLDYRKRFSSPGSSLF